MRPPGEARCWPAFSSRYETSPVNVAFWSPVAPLEASDAVDEASNPTVLVVVGLEPYSERLARVRACRAEREHDLGELENRGNISELLGELRRLRRRIKLPIAVGFGAGWGRQHAFGEHDRIEQEQRIAEEVHLSHETRGEGWAHEREVDVSRTPGVRSVGPGIRAGLHRHKTVTAFGVAYDETPTNDVTRTPRLPDQDRVWLAAGIQYRFGKAGAFEFLRRLKIAKNAVSLGGVETLACHPMTTTHSELTAEELAEACIGEGLVRISIGIEHWRDLLDDFEAALES